MIDTALKICHHCQNQFPFGLNNCSTWKEAATTTNDEMAALSSGNLLTSRSKGCCLWLAFNMQEAKVQLRQHNPTFRLPELLQMTDFKAVIQLLSNAGVKMELVLQFPGLYSTWSMFS